MSAPRALTRNEFLILAALLEKPLHGYGVMKAIAERAGGIRLRPANLYRVLDRLIAFGLLEEIEAETQTEPSLGGDRSRFFAATAAGRRAARAEARLLTGLIRACPDLAAVVATPRSADS